MCKLRERRNYYYIDPADKLSRVRVVKTDAARKRGQMRAISPPSILQTVISKKTRVSGTRVVRREEGKGRN